ncbi:hypothetical protein EJ05DRAFT_512131 [Pseudovirgaria hyperparasitica]|uniref:Uncharacterized protein n=1 Tax=Pseudovirgaria hyperparasitica TaxID=470096 RepID=A0A6A6W381_9PEZI|nr:uncharacterized protein EJ05DRAFT_512131 [Pseudovirgaria hyperparasitica]KAF2756474.1 hypothetical protein EJ05DRAFT_512131 [Pseudovirgaria hyperparasitica]
MAQLAANDARNWDHLHLDVRNAFHQLFESYSFEDEDWLEDEPATGIAKTRVIEVMTGIAQLSLVAWNDAEIRIFCNDDRWRLVSSPQELARLAPNGRAPRALLSALDSGPIWIDVETGMHRPMPWTPKCHDPEPNSRIGPSPYGIYEYVGQRRTHSINLSFCSHRWRRWRFLSGPLAFRDYAMGEPQERLPRSALAESLMDEVRRMFLSPMLLEMLLQTPRFALQKRASGWAACLALDGEHSLGNSDNYVFFALASLLYTQGIVLYEQEADLGALTTIGDQD